MLIITLMITVLLIPLYILRKSSHCQSVVISMGFCMDTNLQTI